MQQRIAPVNLHAISVLLEGHAGLSHVDEDADVRIEHVKGQPLSACQKSVELRGAVQDQYVRLLQFP
jgi:hypothetical protein